MPKRAFLVLAVIAFAASGCDTRPDKGPQVASGEMKIACALGGAQQFSAACDMERTSVEGMRLLIVRHPDGAFRRFEVLTDGRGIAVADGAEEARLALDGQELEVAVGSDRYRFPATRIDRDAQP